MRVAIIGAGIAGLVATRLLARAHEVTVFEANDRAGGHTNTVRVAVDGETYAVDTGFVVYDQGTYPHFARLLAELGVATQSSEMSFSVRCDDGDLEYGGRSLGALLAQPRNVVRPAFHRLVRDILRFNREAAGLARSGDTATIDEHLTAHGYSRELRDWYLVPMAAAIWSAPPAGVLAMPASWVVRFFEHHGL
ncbi:MAG TPA: NAD(P)-binding protein, partial [Candidatus Binatia bacterium]|nr:NAD(P)-binding protein [Candidatus Binatia bacterium]